MCFFELSYDNFHPEGERLYRVNQTNIWNPSGGIMNSTSIPLAQALLQEYPEIEEALRINTPGSGIIRYAGKGSEVKAFNESSILAADSNFFSFFGFKLKEGDPQTALVGKNKVVISAQAAQKILWGQNLFGRNTFIWR